MDVTLHQLRMICELDRQGTIAAAADALGYTPSAVSQQLSALERSVGSELLERVGRSVRLTDAGRIIVQHGNAILDRVELAGVALESSRDTVFGDLRVAAYGSVAATLLPDTLASLARDYPDLTVRTRTGDPEHAVRDLQSGEVDAFFTIEYDTEPTVRPLDIAFEEIFVDRFHLVVPVDDPMPSDASLHQLVGRAIVASSPDSLCGKFVVDACRSAGFEPAVVHHFDEYHTAMRLIAAGVAVGLIPELGLTSRPEGVEVIPLDVPLERRIQLAVRATSTERPSIRAFRSAVRESTSLRCSSCVPGATTSDEKGRA